MTHSEKTEASPVMESTETDGSTKSSEPSPQPGQRPQSGRSQDTEKVQFSIKQLIQLTVVFGLVFAVAKAIGVSGTLAVMGFASFFAPTVFGIISQVGSTRRIRSRIAILGSLVTLSLSGVVFAAAAMRPEAAAGVILASLVAWLPQVAIMHFTRAMWRSGLRSAGIDPEQLDDWR